MSKKLGERLIEKRLITEEQLEQVLKSQLIHGGHLGTCLVEFGLIDEESLGSTLGEMFGAPYAPAAMLQNAPEQAIRSLPCRVVEMHHVIPFQVQDKNLHVAMINPCDLRAIDELSFVSGFRITPWISPEIRIFQAMERFYGVPRRMRYITICQTIDGTPLKGQGAGSGAGSPSESGSSHANSPLAAQSDGENGDGVENDPGLVGPQGAGREAIGEGASALDDYGYGRPWQEIAEELDESDEEEAAPAPRRPTSATRARKERSPSAPRTLEETARLLCQAESKHDLANAVLGYTAGRMERAMLLSVNGDTVSVWDARGISGESRGRPKTKLSITSEGIFELLFGNDYYRGDLPRDTRYLGFYGKLRIQVPEEVLLVPVHYNDRLVSLFYGDGGVNGRIQGEIEPYLRLFRMLSRAIALVIVKKRIQEMALPLSDRVVRLQAPATREA